MPGIYLHIPFCKQACHYCDFHFSTSLKAKTDLIDALVKEIEFQKDYFKRSTPSIKLQTIYFGGGTPSLLSAYEVARIIDKIQKHFLLDSKAEITLEANPDDLTKEKIRALKEAGVNRLSIGVQSFFDEDLKWMNRAHRSVQALQSIKEAQHVGIENITIDLIYGTPILTTERWKKNLQMAFELNVPHLSCYALTIESRTALAHFISAKKEKNVDEQKQSEHFELLMDMAEANGFEQYEISNFAKDQKYSVHNSSYWRKENYLGIGPSAHSYDGKSRQWNIRNNSIYVKSINDGKIPFEKEDLTDSNHFNEYVMTSLRTMWGCNLETMRSDFGAMKAEIFFTAIVKFMNEGLVEQQKQNFILTRKGKFFADRIASELFQSS